jgi:hypothetical protein
VSRRGERRPQKAFEKAERFLDSEEGEEWERGGRSKYRNDRSIKEEDLERVVRKRRREEEAIPKGPRTEADLTPVEPPDFTLSIKSSRPSDAPKLAPRSLRIERRMERLKPVTEKARREEQTQELAQRAQKIAQDAQIDPITHCWGCGIEFQTQHPNQLGYVPARSIEKYKLEKQLFELKSTSRTQMQDLSGDQFIITPEMRELERQIMGLDAEEDEIVETPVSASDPHTHKGAPDRVLCERCWNLKRSSKVVSVAVTAEYFKEIVKPIKELKTRPLIIKMVDLFDFHGSFIPSFRKFVGNNRVMIVASKYDLLPKDAHVARIRSWIYTESKKFGIEPIAVALISNKGFGVRELADQMEHYREGSDVYVMGSANVGKSTFINMLIDIFKGPKDKKVTVSPVPGTTLNFLSLPIGNNSFLYDTPGIITDKQIYQYLSSDELKKIMPKKQINPSVYRLEPGSTLFLGGLARFDYLEGPPLVYFTLFASNEIYVHKTTIEKADELYENQVGALLTPPFQSSLSQWPGLDSPGTIHEINNDDGNWQKACTDIVFSGLGWISLTFKGSAKVRTFFPPGCRVGLRPPLMPFESRLGVLPNPRFNMKPSSISARLKFDQL